MALSEIRHYQSDAVAEAFFIPKTPFIHLIRKIMQDVLGITDAPLGNRDVLRIERDAFIALQLAAEHLLTHVFEMSYEHRREGRELDSVLLGYTPGLLKVEGEKIYEIDSI